MLVSMAAALAAAQPLPIIDIHLHASDPTGIPPFATVCTNAGPLEYPGLDPADGMTLQKAATCPDPVAPATDLAATISAHRAYFEQYNLWGVLDITQGDVESSLAMAEAWQAAMGERLWIAIDFHDLARADWDDETLIAKLEALAEADTVQLFAEVDPQYEQILATDERLDKYFALAARLDIPVGIHLGETAPGATHTIPEPLYSPAFGNPLDLDPLLRKYPSLRVYVMHAGLPMLDEMMAMLKAHPQLYVDIAAQNWMTPRAEFHFQLKRLVDAGFGKRIMYGSDSLWYPDVIPVAIETIEKADFLTEAQKRDIFYNNAARFLRLSEEDIARHHGR
ncbi:amidohydrolase family protein [Sphingomicrobium sediminis]|uniref:Amidohydrolase family protein n=1 Tax=Sphingomicrobium sediminis TaxID=2950949 RepID=A0A9X2EE67_9SPHN|nr:amidohydrolase family protein [Sphingomicrobium sediminis]MCM8556320.1 amidohydrolase family protein [Sphingomicrobium sediminis]